MTRRAIALHPDKKLSPVTGQPFSYACMGCNRRYLVRTDENPSTEKVINVYTFADLARPAAGAHYCIDSLGLTTDDWRAMLPTQD
jgi:hypothetical protein